MYSKSLQSFNGRLFQFVHSSPSNLRHKRTSILFRINLQKALKVSSASTLIRACLTEPVARPLYFPRGHEVHRQERARGMFGFWASLDRKSTRLNSSHVKISYAVFCLKKKTI